MRSPNNFHSYILIAGNIQMSRAPRVDQVINNLYDTIDADGGWMTTLEVIVDGWACQLGNLGLNHQNSGTFIEDYVVGALSEVQEKYRTIAHKDPFSALAMEKPGEIINEGDEISRESFENSLVYHESLRDLGLQHSLMTALPLTENYTAYLRLMRAESMAAFCEKDVRQLKLLLPHLKRVLILTQRLRQLELESNQLASVLDELPTAALLVSEKLNVICGNRRGEALLAEGTCLTVRRGRLTAQHSDGNSALQSAVSRAHRMADGIIGQPMAPPEVICLRRAGRTPLQVLAIPLSPRYRLRQRAGLKARVLLMLYDPEVQTTIMPELLERLFDFTFTEAVVAARLAEGTSIKEIAAERRCSVSTVRTHVKRIMQKTHTSRQGELVQLILTSPAVSLAQ